MSDIPDGYGEWLHQMEKAALKGYGMLYAAWFASDVACRRYALESGRSDALFALAGRKGKKANHVA